MVTESIKLKQHNKNNGVGQKIHCYLFCFICASIREDSLSFYYLYISIQVWNTHQKLNLRVRI